MNFRPISLLQTGYKVFTKILAPRAQKVMGTPIGDSQQGFVHGRQMAKIIMMMLAMLKTARPQADIEADLSRIILLLDFRKAYDTVARDFLFLVLRKFGFSEAFVRLIQRLHNGTTARFIVNRELSAWQKVVSVIRQGCPLAPLLFILAAEILALAIRQDKKIEGMVVPGTTEQRHGFSAFVDDSTVFLQEAKQLPHVVALVRQFGRLSGLQVQPTKSHVIFLNTEIEMANGIPVLRHGDTVRYLGHAVGTGNLWDVNWAQRIRGVQRWLATAAQLATSVENRVLILNVIMLPSVLFTAAVFEMPDWAGNELRNIQKQFLWSHSTAKDAARHKVNPGLLYAPRQAGGVGLVSIDLASKTQLVKQTMLWLIQRRYAYYEAWKAWAWRGMASGQYQEVTPTELVRGRRTRKPKTPGDHLQQLLGEWLTAPSALADEDHERHQQQLLQSEANTIRWTAEDEWVMELPSDPILAKPLKAAAIDTFWPTYSWENNPRIRDATGAVLKKSKYNRIRPYSLAELHIRRTAVGTYVMQIPTVAGKMHRQVKLRRWGLAIVLSSPRMEIGEQLEVHNQIQLRHPTKLESTYRWEATTEGHAHGTSTDRTTGGRSLIELGQQPDGVHWRVNEEKAVDDRTCRDCQHLSRYEEEGGIVFYAHPQIHRFPWSVPDSIANKHVVQALKKLPFRKYRGEGPSVCSQVEKLASSAATNQWQNAVMCQTPNQLWRHRQALTEYQVWVGYRIATRQLNLYHEDRGRDNSCRKLQCCSGIKETLEHIFWACPTAQVC
jgi:hypothetical protein